MADIPLLSSLCLAYAIFFLLFPFLAFSLSSCNGPCRTLDDCEGQLICINSKCNDDPDVGTHICGSVPSPPPPPSSGECQSSGTLICRGQTYPTYTCSPRITSSTPATLLTNDFSEGGNGGGPSECDEKYHNNSDLIVSLSTGWYNGGLLCGTMIKIMADNGRSALAMVVDECDSRLGCDDEHSGQPPCGNNIINGSDAVWSALGLDKELGEANVTWSKVTDVGCDSSNYIVHIM